MNNVTVPLGISGRKSVYSANTNPQTIADEVALLGLGNVVPLDIKINCGQFMKEIAPFKDDWVNYLPRTDRPNNRTALAITNLPGKTHKDNPSLAQACVAAGRMLSETDFSEKTDVYAACHSLTPFLSQWEPLGRTFLVKSNIGGYFVPHRDHPSTPRDVFRLIAFLNKCDTYDYDWLMDDRKLPIELGRVYYVNTRLMHRTISWVDDSIHLILNVPFTTENVSKVIANLQHTH